MQLGRQLTAESLDESDALLRKVLEIDPRYAPAWSERASNLANKATAGLMPGQESYTRARESAEQALALDPDYVDPTPLPTVDRVPYSSLNPA